jgi:predicted transcriptional regulator
MRPPQSAASFLSFDHAELSEACGEPIIGARRVVLVHHIEDAVDCIIGMRCDARLNMICQNHFDLPDDRYKERMGQLALRVRDTARPGNSTPVVTSGAILPIYGILIDMSPGNKKLLEQIASWPVEDQEELVEVAREIESRRTGIYRLTDDERAAVRAGMDAARRGEFAPEAEMEDFYKLHHRP